MKIILVILGFLIGSSAIAADFCVKEAFDPEVPAGLEGQYEVIGKDPVTNKAYSVHLVITTGKNTYGIVRTINGKTLKGQAWIERCGPDRISFLTVDYDTKPSTGASCRLGADYDNYYRVTCLTGVGENSWRGLEAWFQKHDLVRPNN